MNQYRKHFDELGQLRAGDFSPWTRAEKAVLICFVFTIVLIGVL